MSKTISARIDDTMHTMVTDEANQEGITVNEKLKEMLNGHFNNEEKKEILPSQKEELEIHWCAIKNQENKIEEIQKELPKMVNSIYESLKKIEDKTIERVNQEMNKHESIYKHITKCI